MAAPRVSQAVKDLTQKGAQQGADKGGYNAPGTYDLDKTLNLTIVASTISIGNFTHAAHSQTETCRVADQLYRRLIQSHQTHAQRTKQQSGQLVANQSDEYVHCLNATKESGIFDYLAVV